MREEEIIDGVLAVYEKKKKFYQKQNFGRVFLLGGEVREGLFFFTLEKNLFTFFYVDFIHICHFCFVVGSHILICGR